MIKTFIIYLTIQLGHAWETEQYTLPPEKLHDIGPQISNYVFERFQLAINETNRLKSSLPKEIQTLEKHLQELGYSRGSLRNSRLRIRRRLLKSKIKDKKKLLTRLKTKSGIIEQVSASIGRPIAVEEKRDAIFGTPIKIISHNKKTKENIDKAQPKQTYYYPSKTQSVYAHAGYHRILHCSYFIFSSTINMYGVEIGMDKLGHFFNEGLKYYRVYSKQLDLMKTVTDENKAIAIKKAIDWGINSEKSYFGLWVSGVYSNADLASNLAGLYFYRNLFETVIVNGITYPPMLEITNDGHINIARHVNQENIIRHFFGTHMNEAFNASSLERLQLKAVKKRAKTQCEPWRVRYKNLSFYDLQEIEKSTHRWNNLDYGHRSKNTINMSELCFRDNLEYH